MNWGERIRILRIDRGLSQTKLAELTDLSRSYICRVENGEYQNPRRDTFTRLADGLGMSMSELDEVLRNDHNLLLDTNFNYSQLIRQLLSDRDFDVSLTVTLIQKKKEPDKLKQKNQGLSPLENYL